MFLPHWLLAQFLGIVCAALFEAPFLNIQKTVAHHSRTKTEESVGLKSEDNGHNEEHRQQEMLPL